MGRNKRAVVAFQIEGVPVRLAPRPRVDPVRRALENAPWDDEPLTEDEVRALDEAEAEEGPRYSSADVRRILGL